MSNPFFRTNPHPRLTGLKGGIPCLASFRGDRNSLRKGYNNELLCSDASPRQGGVMRKPTGVAPPCIDMDRHVYISKNNCVVGWAACRARAPQRVRGGIELQRWPSLPRPEDHLPRAPPPASPGLEARRLSLLRTSALLEEDRLPPNLVIPLRHF